MYDLNELAEVRSMPGYPLEEQEQAWLIQWTRRHGPEPAKRLLAIPNGGHRSHSQGALLKLTGVRPGVPDLFLPVPVAPYHGLWIEMKSLNPASRATKDQKDWLGYLEEQGYRAVVCKGFEAARDAVLDYLDQETP